MSISVEDLVASFSSNHIGQEALDLAALQAQLTETLVAQSPSTQAIPHRGYVQPANTPSRTPSSSMCWDPREFGRGRSSSVASIGQQLANERKRDFEETEEDERMVEDMLFSTPPPTSASPHHALCHSFSHAPSSAPPTRSQVAPVTFSYDYAQYDLPSPNTSLFATTDPFLMAQLQAAQNPTPSPFAQSGRPSPHSPFLAHQLQSVYSHRSMQAEADVHNLFAAAAAF
ncbi:hypothetical protein BKA93DRAFT_823977 [Sparassis latifolia]